MNVGSFHLFKFFQQYFLVFIVCLFADFPTLLSFVFIFCSEKFYFPYFLFCIFCSCFFVVTMGITFNILKLHTNSNLYKVNFSNTLCFQMTLSPLGFSYWCHKITFIYIMCPKKLIILCISLQNSVENKIWRKKPKVRIVLAFIITHIFTCESSSVVSDCL